MKQVTCQCGATIKVFKNAYNRAATCIHCKRPVRFIVAPRDAMSAAASAGPVDFGLCLVIETGPMGVGRQFFLGETGPIGVGKLPQNLLRLSGDEVSRQHCTLIPVSPGRWRVRDNASRNGVFVNGQRTKDQELHNGDVLAIGEFSLRCHCPDDEAAFAFAAELEAGFVEEDAYDARSGNEGTVYAAVLPPEPRAARPKTPPPPQEEDFVYDFAPEPDRPVRPASQTQLVSAPASSAPARFCPSCKRQLGPRDKICVNCGIDVKTGKPLRISHAVDENILYGNVETAARLLSWLFRIMLIPIASDAYGKSKPYAMRAIAIVTIAVTIGVWIMNATGGQGQFGQTKNLMLWAGDQPNPMVTFAAMTERGQPGEFHYYQLLTNIFLHASIMHLAGNMVFFLVFANRVNALLGQWKAAASYILLGVLASAAVYITDFGRPLIPTLGASGAIMGMAACISSSCLSVASIWCSGRAWAFSPHFDGTPKYSP
ncbi:MAG: rhomboid family intramembrane serine protease [Tepidisphaeraceae bacterium]|jgi:membrane associated rhomboid family serine protease